MPRSALCTHCLASSCSFAVIQAILCSAEHLPTSCCTLMAACSPPWVRHPVKSLGVSCQGWYHTVRVPFGIDTIQYSGVLYGIA